MVRRGPDDEGFWTDGERCALGFRRLSILDSVRGPSTDARRGQRARARVQRRDLQLQRSSRPAGCARTQASLVGRCRGAVARALASGGPAPRTIERHVLARLLRRARASPPARARSRAGSSRSTTRPRRVGSCSPRSTIRSWRIPGVAPERRSRPGSACTFGSASFPRRTGSTLGRASSNPGSGWSSMHEEAHAPAGSSSCHVDSSQSPRSRRDRGAGRRTRSARSSVTSCPTCRSGCCSRVASTRRSSQQRLRASYPDRFRRSRSRSTTRGSTKAPMRARYARGARAPPRRRARDAADALALLERRGRGVDGADRRLLDVSDAAGQPARATSTSRSCCRATAETSCSGAIRVGFGSTIAQARYFGWPRPVRLAAIAARRLLGRGAATRDVLRYSSLGGSTSENTR